MIGAKQFASITFQFLHFCIDWSSLWYFIQPVFLRCVIYIFLLISVSRRVVLNSISWFLLLLKEHRKCFHSICTCTMSDEKYVLHRLYAYSICASTYLHLQKENLIPLLQFWSGSTLMQKCLKNIKRRDVDYRNQVWVRVLSRPNLAWVIQTGHLLHEA